ncbi:zinc finger HIT domain-containing protein 2 [Macadamia integrifolia]|uniref:zinc finger HIT domain-containing protein 2 n=1 Tax=Macadamia integrifolia TaxID=60698 RepID=UPI001C50212A|nr:zinc finger HIT domain-containing protein 2 [Macadamia integrifolia]
MKHLQRVVASGELSKMIHPWEPWWSKHSATTISLSQEGTKLVQPLHEEDVRKSAEDNSESVESTIIPPGPETPLPPISKLSSMAPSPLLAVHLVDTIYSYCFTLRFYNGDWQSDALGAAMVVLNVSFVLGEGGQPETVSQALSHCLEQTCSPAYRHVGGLNFGLCLIDDVVKLLSLGGAALVCLLCDLQRLIQAGLRELKAEKPRKLKRVEVGTKLKLAEKKVYFLMCWVHGQPKEFWSSLMAIVGVEKDLIASLRHEGGHVKVDAKPKSKGKVIIEEV